MNKFILFFLLGFLIGIILTSAIAISERQKVIDEANQEMSDYFDAHCKKPLNINFNTSGVDLNG